MMQKKFLDRYAVAAAIALLCLLQGCASNHLTVNRSDVEIINGDTIRVKDESVQILGMDAPDSQNPHCNLEKQLGQKSTQALSNLLGSGKIEMDRVGGLDEYGRTLARLSIDGKDVADTMTSQGDARSYTGGKRQSWCE